MAYGIKWYTSYQGINNKTTLINILENNYTGSTTELIASTDPLLINFTTNVENIFEQATGTGAIIRVDAEPLSLIGLFTSDPQKYIVKCYYSGDSLTLFWQGFVNAKSGYNEDYSIGTGSTTTITLKCNDGISVLDQLFYKNINVYGNSIFYSGNSTIGQVIVNVLAKISGLTFNNVYTNFDLSLILGETNFFNNIWSNNENYIDESLIAMSCKEVLNSIFSGIDSLVIKIIGQDLYILNPINLHDETLGKKYTLPDFTESAENIGGVIDLSGQTTTGCTLEYYITGQNLDIINQVDEVEISYDPYNYQNFSYDFNDADNHSTAGTFDNQTGWYYNSTVIFSNWTKIGNVFFLGVKETLTDNPTFALYLSNSNQPIVYNIPHSNLHGDYNINMKIGFDSFAQTKVASANIFSSAAQTLFNAYNIQYSIKIGEQYWKTDRWEAGATGAYKQQMLIRDYSISNAKYTTNKVLSQVSDTWTEASKLIPLATAISGQAEGGYIEFTIYDHWTEADVVSAGANWLNLKRILIKNFNIEFQNNVSGQAIGNPGIKKLGNISTNTRYKSNLTNIKTTTGTGSYGISRGNLLDFANAALIGLFRDGDATIHATAELAMQSFISQYKQPRKQLNAVLNIKNYDLGLIQNKLIRDKTYLVDGKAFYIYNYSYNDADESLNVSMIEMESTKEDL